MSEEIPIPEVGSILEMDEIYEENLPDGRIRIVFLTTGLSKRLVPLKARLFLLFRAPMQVPEEVEVEDIQPGLIFKRYKVTAVARPLFKIHLGE